MWTLQRVCPSYKYALYILVDIILNIVNEKKRTIYNKDLILPLTLERVKDVNFSMNHASGY